MKRIFVSTWLLAGGLAVSIAAPADAQLSASVQVSWHWSEDGWRSGPVVDGYVHWSDHREGRTVYRDRAPVRVRPVVRPRLRIPPGHMPPAGMCRTWLVGVPPGHQPPPRPCSRALFAYHGADVVILHTPRRDGRWWSPYEERRWTDRARGYDDRWDDDWDEWDDDRWDDDDWEDDRGRRGRGGPPGRGRGRG